MNEEQILREGRRWLSLGLALTYAIYAMTVLVACTDSEKEVFEPRECHTFEYKTPLADNSPGVCKVLWCEDGWGKAKSGGPAVLWCRPLNPGELPAVVGPALGLRSRYETSQAAQDEQDKAQGRGSASMGLK